MADQTVRELLTRWGFDVDTKPIDQFNKSISDAKQVVIAIGAQAIAQAGALFGLANSVAATGDEFAKTASRIGFNVESLQEYAHVANLAGSSTQEMNSAIEELTLGISEARKGGGKLIEPLIRLNQLTGKDLLTNLGNADDVMLQLADTFSQMTDKTEKAELAQKIFGGTGLAMVNVLNQGSSAIREQRQEARDLGIVLSQDAAKKSEEFQDTLLRVKETIKGLRNIVGVDLLPVVIDFMNQFKEWIMLNREWLRSGISKVLTVFADGTRKLIDLVRRMVKIIDSAITSFGGLENVIKFATIALSTFAGFKFLSAIGNMVSAIGFGLVNAFQAAGRASLLAQAKMLIMPALIGAAIAGIFLIIDDLIAYFQGRDSVTGQILKALEGLDIASVITDKLDEAINVIQRYKDRINTFIADLFDFPNLGESISKGVKSGLEGIDELFTDLNLDNFGEKISQALFNAVTGEGITGKLFEFFLNAFAALGDALLIVIGGVMSSVTDIIAGAVKGAFDFSGSNGILTKGTEGIKNAISGVGDFFGFGNEDTQNNLAAVGAGNTGLGNNIQKPQLSLIKGGASGGQQNITNNNNINVPVNLPQGVNANEGTRMVEQGIRNALEKMARETHAATKTNVER